MARTSISTILPRATVKLITENTRPSNVRDRIPAAPVTRTGVTETPACRNINAPPATAAAPRVAPCASRVSSTSAPPRRKRPKPGSRRHRPGAATRLLTKQRGCPGSRCPSSTGARSAADATRLAAFGLGAPVRRVERIGSGRGRPQRAVPAEHVRGPLGHKTGWPDPGGRTRPRARGIRGRRSNVAPCDGSRDVLRQG